MHYLDEGDGFPVLMLHGNPTWSFLYREVITALRDSCRCIAPDYPGFGFSEHPPDYGYTPREHSEWIAALIDELELERYVLVVQDWGGPIGLAAALHRPEQVAGIVLLNTWCWKPDRSMRLFSRIVGGGPARYLHLQYNLFARFLLPLGITRKERKRADILQAYRAPFPTPATRQGTWVFPREIVHSSEWLGGIETRLPELAGRPVEMVWAMKDPAFRHERFIRHWYRHFPDAPVERLPDAGHYLQEDRPDRVVAGIGRVLGRIPERPPPAPYSRTT